MGGNPLLNLLLSILLAVLFVFLGWTSTIIFDGYNEILALGVIFLIYIIATIYIYQNSFTRIEKFNNSKEIKDIMNEVNKKSEIKIEKKAKRRKK